MFDKTKKELEAWLESSLLHLKEIKAAIAEEVRRFMQEAREDYEKRKAQQCQKADQEHKQ